MCSVDIRECESQLEISPKIWLITGVAGFIGSNLLEYLLRLNQKVVGLDNLSTGYRRNLAAVKAVVSQSQWARFHFIEGDIRNPDDCRAAVAGVNIILHQAALGSVPRSLNDPIASHESNVNGFLNMLVAARDAGIQRFIYAASSSTYGDHPGLPKVEDRIGKPLSPYAVTKLINELYADVFARCYEIKVIGLRYFNVFGPRQDPDGPYAAVMPLWFRGLIKHEPIYINGDGETSRDFCFVANAVQMNVLAACANADNALNQVYNVAVGQRTTLNELYQLIREVVSEYIPDTPSNPIYRAFRPGDVRHSLADISKAKQLLGYQPSHTVAQGLSVAADYYIKLYI